MSVLLRGQGVAVSTAAHLLGRAGIPLLREPGARNAVPAILLSDAALALLRDVFSQPSLFADKPRIERRVVAWGDATPVSMPHGGAVVSQNDLAQALDDLPDTNPAPTDGQASLILHAMVPFPAPALRRFGCRQSTAVPVRLAAEAAERTCWIESVTTGWLFLIPEGTGAAWLLAIGDVPEALLARSTLVAPLIERLGATGPAFDTSPRMVERLAGEGWLAFGTAALAFDPICGDGTAQAVREGILASGVVTALARGEDPLALAIHHHSILLASMRRHLQLALPFYASGGTSGWWREQFAATREGYDWCTAQLGQLPEPRFAIHGFDLVRRELAA